MRSVVVLALVLATGLQADERPKPPAAVAVKVVDGATLVVDGETVRLRGVDAPVNGAPGFEEAREALRRLLAPVLAPAEDAKPAVLTLRDEVAGTPERDAQGRRLVYAFVGARHVNLAMVAEGCAWAEGERARRHDAAFRAASEAARKALKRASSRILTTVIEDIRAMMRAKPAKAGAVDWVQLRLGGKERELWFRLPAKGATLLPRDLYPPREGQRGAPGPKRLGLRRWRLGRDIAVRGVTPLMLTRFGLRMRCVPTSEPAIPNVWEWIIKVDDLEAGELVQHVQFIVAR